MPAVSRNGVNLEKKIGQIMTRHLSDGGEIDEKRSHTGKSKNLRKRTASANLHRVDVMEEACVVRTYEERKESV